MASSKVNLNIHKEFIKSLYLNESVIINNITAILIKRIGQTISRRTLKCRFNNWNWKRQIYTRDTSELREEINDTFYPKTAVNDNELYEEMRDKKFQIIKRGVVQLRRKLAESIRYSKEFRFLTDEYARVVINEKF
jgi:hypothetical protein